MGKRAPGAVRVLIVAALASQVAGCFTYAINVDGPSGEAIGFLAGVDVAAGLAIGVAMKVSDNSLGSLAEDLAAGVVAALIVDLAIGLGVTAADFGANGNTGATDLGGLPAMRSGR